jgi:hypothetical protein
MLRLVRRRSAGPPSPTVPGQAPPSIPIAPAPLTDRLFAVVGRRIRWWMGAPPWYVEGLRGHDFFLSRHTTPKAGICLPGPLLITRPREKVSPWREPTSVAGMAPYPADRIISLFWSVAAAVNRSLDVAIENSNCISKVPLAVSVASAEATTPITLVHFRDAAPVFGILEPASRDAPSRAGSVLPSCLRHSCRLRTAGRARLADRTASCNHPTTRPFPSSDHGKT